MDLLSPARWDSLPLWPCLLLLVAINVGLLGLRYAVTRSLVDGDAVQYFMSLRSPLIDGDLDFADEYRHFHDDVSPYTGNRKVEKTPDPDPFTGKAPNQMPIGTALA